MKKIVILLVFVLAISTYSFAETGIGVSVAYPIANFSDNFDVADLGFESFMYGINLRQKASIFLLDVSLYSNIALDGLYIPLDVGFCFDFFTFIRFGVGAGISAFYSFGEEDLQLSTIWYPNIKVNVDFKLGNITLGVSGMYNIPINPTTDLTVWETQWDYLISTEAILDSVLVSINLLYWFDGDKNKTSE